MQRRLGRYEVKYREIKAKYTLLDVYNRAIRMLSTVKRTDTPFLCTIIVV